MSTLARTIQYFNDALIMSLAVLAVAQWRRRRDAASAWLAVTFGVLGFVVLGTLALPDHGVDGGFPLVVQRLLIVLLAAFPYALYRFATGFEHGGRKGARLAAASLALVAVVTIFLPSLPGRGQPRPGWFTAYAALFMAHWTLLSGTVGVRLWRGGRGRPTVARRRMRVLSLASVLLTGILLVASFVPAPSVERGLRDVVTGLVATVAVVLLFGAFSPPPLVRLLWRRPEERALQEAQLRLMAVDTLPQVADQLLPHAVALTGARAAALLDVSGAVVGCRGMTAAEVPSQVAAEEPLQMPLRHGTLLVWSSPFTPWFGREELDLLRSFGVVVDLAWARSELLAHRRQMLDRLEEAQRIARMGAWEWDPRDDRVVWSDELYRIFGLEPGEQPATYAGFLEFVHPEDRLVVDQTVMRTAEKGGTFAMDHRIVRPDGSVRVLHGQGRVLLGVDGRPARLVGTGQDITERKRNEQELNGAYEREREARMAYERANQELEAFVYSVSHDLKSPIISLLGYLDYLRIDYGDGLPDEALHYLDRMAASANYMDALIRDLLELSRIGRVQVEPAVVDLGAVVDEVAGELGIAYPAAMVEHDPLPALWMNPLRARQLMTNLVGNALRHGGRPDVRVSVLARTDADGRWEVAVEDNGPGIPEPYRERVFGVFERLGFADDTVEEGSVPGTGIGLAICRKIVEALGGTAAVTGRDDGRSGTRIVLSIPASVVHTAVSGSRTGEMA